MKISIYFLVVTLTTISYVKSQMLEPFIGNQFNKYNDDVEGMVFDLRSQIPPEGDGQVDPGPEGDVVEVDPAEGGEIPPDEGGEVGPDPGGDVGPGQGTGEVGPERGDTIETVTYPNGTAGSVALTERGDGTFCNVSISGSDGTTFEVIRIKDCVYRRTTDAPVTDKIVQVSSANSNCNVTISPAKAGNDRCFVRAFADPGCTFRGKGIQLVPDNEKQVGNIPPPGTPQEPGNGPESEPGSPIDRRRRRQLGAIDYSPDTEVEYIDDGESFGRAPSDDGMDEMGDGQVGPGDGGVEPEVEVVGATEVQTYPDGKPLEVPAGVRVLEYMPPGCVVTVTRSNGDLRRFNGSETPLFTNQPVDSNGNIKPVDGNGNPVDGSGHPVDSNGDKAVTDSDGNLVTNEDGERVTDGDGDLVDANGNKVITDENGNVVSTEDPNEVTKQVSEDDPEDPMIKKLRLAAIILGAILVILLVVIIILCICVK